MIKKNILCTICARKGSKGLKNKNFKDLNSKPLIYHTILQAKKSKIFDKIVVSSDSNKILLLSKKFKVDYLIKRPKKLANDHCGKIDVIKHALIMSEKKFKVIFDIIIDLDVTSPLRSTSDINKALDFFFKKNSGNLVSGYEARRNPYFNQVMLKNNRLSIPCRSRGKIFSRQKAPKVFDLNASIYIWRRNALIKEKNLINKKTLLYEMPDSRSIDIDNMFDFKLVQFIFKNKLFKYND